MVALKRQERITSNSMRWFRQRTRVIPSEENRRLLQTKGENCFWRNERIYLEDRRGLLKMAEKDSFSYQESITLDDRRWLLQTAGEDSYRRQERLFQMVGGGCFRWQVRITSREDWFRWQKKIIKSERQKDKRTLF